MAQEQITAAQCLALVEQSPEAVARHDKSAWLALFAADNIVEDPVGSVPHVSPAGDAVQSVDHLSRFYETFIAPNSIRFDVDRDMVCGMHVVRDLTIEITMSPQVIVRVPVHLLYELEVESGALKIVRLAAHWELWPMLKQQIVLRWPNIKVMTASAGRMLRYLGVGGIVGFLRAISSVGSAGKRKVGLFMDYFNQGRVAELTGLCVGSDIEIGFPHEGRRLSIADFVGEGGKMRFDKMLAAGHFISATFSHQLEGVSHDGVALFELDRSRLQIVALTFYWQD